MERIILGAVLSWAALGHAQLVSHHIDSRGRAALLQVDMRKRGRSELAGEVPQSVELKVGDRSTGIMMPLIGLGAAQQGEPLKAAIATFLAHGGRLIDTAILYGQKPLGEALHTAMHEGGMAREQFWVTSKILPTLANTSEQTLVLVDQSLADLGLDYVDLFLIHWPGPSMVEIWKGLLKAKEAGKVKAIGVSNFSPEQITQLEVASGERPSVNQLEYHPWVSAEVHDNVRWCLDHGVAVTAYGSLGGDPNRPLFHDGMHDAKVQAVADKHRVTPGQVLLRWALEQGVAVIPQASSERHIIEDLNAGSFNLDADEASKDFFGQ